MAPKSPVDEDGRKKTSHKSAKGAKDHHKKHKDHHKDHHKNKHTKTPPDEGLPSTGAILLQMPPEMCQPFPEGDAEYASYRELSSKKGSEMLAFVTPTDENDTAADKEGDAEYASYRERRSKKESETLVFVTSTDENDTAADKEQDMSSTGRFCILLGALGIMAMAIYFVMHLYQWVGPSEKILIVDNSTTTPLAENIATSAMSRYA